jgi:hypothetical protein
LSRYAPLPSMLIAMTACNLIRMPKLLGWTAAQAV